MGIFSKKKPKEVKEVKDNRTIKITKETTTRETETGKTSDTRYTISRRHRRFTNTSSVEFGMWTPDASLTEADFKGLVEEIIKDFSVNDLARIISEMYQKNSTKIMFRRYAPLEVIGEE